MTNHNRLSILTWVIILLAASWLLYAMITTSMETRAEQNARREKLQMEPLAREPYIEPNWPEESRIPQNVYWTLPAKPAPEEGMVLMPRRNNSGELKWVATQILALSPEEWEIIIGTDADELVVFYEKGKAVCSLKFVNGQLTWIGDEQKALEIIEKYIESRKIQ